MNGNRNIRVLRGSGIIGAQYPKFSILLALLLIYLAPFVSSLLAYMALIICVYRVVRYDARVFAADYCLLFPVSRLFSTAGGFTLLVWLCLFASIWYVLRRGIRADGAYLFLFAILNYLMFRMQMQIGNLGLCFGHIFMLCVLVPLQDEQSAERAAKLYCVGLLVSSAYALAFRNTWQIRAVGGAESEAIWGTGILRFSGLLRDPNFYMTLILIGLALLVKLKECSLLKPWKFWTMGVILALFGALTYSKAFIVGFVILAGLYIIWQLWNKKIISTAVLIIAALAAGSFLIFSEYSPFAVTIERFLSAKNLNDLTTGRWNVYQAYWEAITEDVGSFFFGKGMAAKELYKAPHNIYLEIWYYLGATGMLLFAGFVISLIKAMKRYHPRADRQNVLSKYVTLLMVIVLYLSLHGIFQTIFYGDLFVALLSFVIMKKEPGERSEIRETSESAKEEGMS